MVPMVFFLLVLLSPLGRQRLITMPGEEISRLPMGVSALVVLVLKARDSCHPKETQKKQTENGWRPEGCVFFPALLVLGKALSC